ncbi:uncharacterized protein LOC111051481 [Nilaparvata lugens]|uniref:uncharacterized protein LOC111051481 n=1 Tax=Nilaparvata lugens TaxID=108931 RepID=UPI00193E0146|nr:uncharacterized protein LOC111051481 [Nilaparvata lugens]
MRLYYLVHYAIYALFRSILVLHVYLVSSSSLDDFFPYTYLTEDMKKAGFNDGVRDYNFVFPKKVDAGDSLLSNFYNIEDHDDTHTSEKERRCDVLYPVKYLLSLGNKDQSEDLELQIELTPNVELAPRSLVIERLDKASRLDVGKAKLQQLGDLRCYFVGRVTDQPGSSVALSACGRGLLGVVQTKDDRFFIQPLSTRKSLEGNNMHIVYRKKSKHSRKLPHCLVKEPIEDQPENIEKYLIAKSEISKPPKSISTYSHDLYNFEKAIASPRIVPEFANYETFEKDKPLQRLEIVNRIGDNFTGNNNNFIESFSNDFLLGNLESNIANENELESEKYRNLDNVNKLHSNTSIIRKRRDASEISAVRNQQNITPLDVFGESITTNSSQADSKIINLESQEDISTLGDSQNGTLRLGRSCEFVQHKRKIEPVYDVRVLMVASKHFCDQFDTFDVETLILTLMNMVHLHFHDASIGQLIYVKIVRIIFIQYNMEELDERKHSLEDLFANFCKFQDRVNPLLTNHPNRHDIAIFLTQSASHNKCGNPPVYGATYSKSVCRDDKRCILVTNHGLLTANIITHALGHSFGAVHDDGSEGNCQSKSEEGSSYLMAPTITYSATTWSLCSRRAISRFVLHHASKCLLGYTKPVNYQWTRELLPGQIYTASQQCTLNYRMPTLACFNGDFCRKLYCKMNEHECVSNGEPPADGTYCAKNMWCMRGECRWKGASTEAAINGGWSDWSDWSPCSRHCGVGVQRANRYCNNPPPARGGNICAGRRTRYRVCNQHVPCPISEPTFRDEQCQLTSSYPLDDGGRRTDWHEWAGGPDAEDVGCALVCESFTGIVAVRDVTAANGTPCKPGTNDLCIRGSCVPVGCDWVLGSRTRRDACGICRGGGTTCKIIQGFYSEKNGTGYVPFLKVPRGSAMIYVRQIKPSDSLLAVSSSNAGDFYLNGPRNDDDITTPALSKRFQLAGAPAIYKVKSGMERLFIDGTVQEDLIFFLKFGNLGNPGVRYQLAVNRDKKSEFEPFYSWRFIEWQPCSHPCGGGYQVAEPVCVEDTNGIVDDSYCPDELRPTPITRLCNSFPCKPRWWVGPWSKCVKRANKRIKTRAVFCIFTQDSTSPTFRIIKDLQCTCKPKPQCSKLCHPKTASPAQSPCPDEEDTPLHAKSAYYQQQETSMEENRDLFLNNKWNERISNFHSNNLINDQPPIPFEQIRSHDNLENMSLYIENDDFSNEPNNDSRLSNQIIEGDFSKLDVQLNNSSLVPISEAESFGNNLDLGSNLDAMEGDIEVQKSLGEISGKIKRSFKSTNNKAESSNDNEIFDEFFLDATDNNSESKVSSSVKDSLEHITKSAIHGHSTAFEEQKIDNSQKHVRNKPEITNASGVVNSHLKSKEVKKLTQTPTGTLYGLLLTNKLGEPPTLKVSKSLSNADSPRENMTALSNRIKLVEDNKKNRTEERELSPSELAERVASKVKQKMEAQERPCKTPCTERATFATGPTCKVRTTTCRHPDLCFPTAAPDTPKKICHEIIENDLSSFVLIRAPIACERSINAFNDGLYEGDGLLSLLPVVNETCPIFLKGDAAIKYLEDSRRCFSGPIQQNHLLTLV